MHSIPHVCDVELVRGARAGGEPDLVLEVPHGATLAIHYDALRAELSGPYPHDLRDFFFVNTDVGAPEVARRVAELVTEAEPGRSAVVLRCLLPRTFVDCNRLIDVDTLPATSAPGALTAGLHAWVRSPEDRRLLLERYSAYRALVEETVGRVCGGGGQALMVHTYAPRSVEVQVDDDIVASLHAAYAPDTVVRWPLRPHVDLIVDTPEGERLADDSLVEALRAGFAGAGLEVALNGAYALHPATLAAALARRYAHRTLCLEIRRDLLVPEFTPFAEMHPDPARVERVARPLAEALRG